MKDVLFNNSVLSKSARKSPAGGGGMGDVYFNNSVLSKSAKRFPADENASEEISSCVVARQKFDRLLNQTKAMEAEIKEACKHISKEDPMYETVMHEANELMNQVKAMEAEIRKMCEQLDAICERGR